MVLPQNVNANPINGTYSHNPTSNGHGHSDVGVVVGNSSSIDETGGDGARDPIDALERFMFGDNQVPREFQGAKGRDLMMAAHRQLIRADQLKYRRALLAALTMTPVGQAALNQTDNGNNNSTSNEDSEIYQKLLEIMNADEKMEKERHDMEMEEKKWAVEKQKMWMDMDKKEREANPELAFLVAKNNATELAMLQDQVLSHRLMAWQEIKNAAATAAGGKMDED